jgi:hypothetical protein
MILSGIAQVPHAVTFGLAEQAWADPAVRAEAELASLQIARGLGPSQPALIEPVLTRLVVGTSNPSVRAEARALLNQINSGWLCAGPYRVEGRQTQELFDVAFAPEKTGETAVEWIRAPGFPDAARPGEVDLSGIVNGDHAVVYLKTQVYVPRARKVNIAVGSDDGVKLWVNGELVHANNVIRGLTAGEDRCSAQLRQGTNDFLAKITQHTLGCAFALQITSSEGAAVPGLRIGAGAK